MASIKPVGVSGSDIDVGHADRRSAPILELLILGFSISAPPLIRWRVSASKAEQKSAIAGVERIGWNTVDRWLEKAATAVEGQAFHPVELEALLSANSDSDNWHSDAVNGRISEQIRTMEV